jgi:hypothetical protein
MSDNDGIYNQQWVWSKDENWVLGNEDIIQTMSGDAWHLDGTKKSYPCDTLGHSVDEWSEYLDGQCAGYCSLCGGRVATVRMPGGVIGLRIRYLTQAMLERPDSIDSVAEMSELEELLEKEEEALVEARSLLKTAREMGKWKKAE